MLKTQAPLGGHAVDKLYMSEMGVRVLGINAILHDPSAALVLNGAVAAAAEEERFSRRRHGKRMEPWELREQAAAWCLAEAGMDASELDAIAYSYDPAICGHCEPGGLCDPWDYLRTIGTHSLLGDPALAAETGLARIAAIGRYGLARFIDDWDPLLKEVPR